MNTAQMIVSNGLCVGCGVCSGICPARNLEMRFNDYGEYNPYDTGKCIDGCSKCISVCPFSDKADSEDIIAKENFGYIPNINHRPETGYFLNCYAGFSPQHRADGASGGITRWLLEKLIENGSVSAVVIVVPNNDPERLFKYSILRNPREIQKSGGSAYYPVELSEVIKEIKKSENTSFAAVGLPCFIKALRLACKIDPILKSRIKFFIGLTCGQLKSKKYADYLSQMAGAIKPDKVNFRVKDSARPASDFAFAVAGKKLFWSETVAPIYINRMFTIPACNYCDDIFAETADIVLMDAWLPAYSKDWRGNNILITRNRFIDDIISKSGLPLDKISIESVIKSQRGVVEVKRNHLSHRLFAALKQNKNIPMKRVSAKKADIFTSLEIFFKDKIQQISRQTDTARCEEQIKFHIKKLEFLNKIKSLILLPFRVAKKLARIMKYENRE